MMPEMICREIVRPTAMICSIIICLFSIVSLLLEKRSAYKNVRKSFA
jgi:hypothetical protein